MTKIYTPDDSDILRSLRQRNIQSLKCEILKCEVELTPDFSVIAYSFDDYILVQPNQKDCYPNDFYIYKNVEEVDPFIKIKSFSEGYHKMVTREVRNLSYFYRGEPEKESVIDTYGDRWESNGMRATGKMVPGIPWNYLKVVIESNDGVIRECELKYKRPNTGKATINGYDINFKYNFFGLDLHWSESLIDNKRYRYTHHPLEKVWNVLKNYEISEEDKTNLWIAFLDLELSKIKEIPLNGVKALEKRKTIKSNLEKLEQEEPLLWKFYLWLHDDRTREKVSNNQLLAAFLKEAGNDYNEIKKQLKTVMNNVCHIDSLNIIDSYLNNPISNRQLCLMFSAAQEKERERREKHEWYLRKSLSEQAEGLGIAHYKYPKLFKLIEQRDIPLNVFHPPKDKLQIINAEFSIWEKALLRDGWENTICEIASNASRRSTYEKDITPYISFLFKIEKYLEKHTGKKWSALPKFVNSQWELEMDEPEEGQQTVKKRSALTPIADNENNIITVPYAAIAITGRQTTYCYSKHYFVFEEYMIDDESGTVVERELEPKLNGRDDYGLMYYTLTGTPRNRGYPTFLIIFERLKHNTRVHFHRVHPNKYKDGRTIPACKLIEECYRYMAGNVRAEEIYAQQGDLIFIQSNEPKDLEKLRSISDFESHEFISENGEYVKLSENKAKSIRNRLGYIFSNSNFVVDHPEHEPLKDMPAGWYEVRRCKSWEANPTAVWSFTID